MLMIYELISTHDFKRDKTILKDNWNGNDLIRKACNHVSKVCHYVTSVE